ncbi:MAG: MBL fold metallo-hydrolase [Deltaproteobacteria bacterium]|uniref:MBL fold metallo-hydrolase n=1 Tax=Desulfobacula sp. TaxID=2593537 RepID=UPI00198563D5|nr:MBL fold metallo-hydrolase [Candidatus Desulfobacula maris]MBL6996011.1 MBL fold metallo-hydrolase [Desulfobacula sp.]
MRVCELYDFNGIKGFKLGWSLFGPPLMTVYCYTFGDLMVDTGQSHMQKQALKIAEDNNIKRIFLTHHHEDHSGNAAAIKQVLGVRVFGHTLTKEKMKARFSILPYQKYVWGKARPLNIEIVSERIETVFGDMVPVHTPGHSKDHTVYLLKKEGVLFSGDLYLADRIKFFRSDEDMGIQIESLKKVLKLDFQTFLCNHYPKLEHGKKRIEQKLGFLEDLYGNVIMLWEKGYLEKQIFKVLKLKEDYFIKYFCFGNVSMINGVRSAVRHYEANKG